MEIKANNVLIGTFVLIGLFAAFAFAMWLGRMSLDRQYSYYQINFKGSVSGLSESGAVQFNGLRVGRVTELFLDEVDPNKVTAIVQLDPRTPVKVDTVAKLELSALSGVAIIELSGGSGSSPALKRKQGETYPVIDAKPSTLQELAMAAPETLQNAKRLMERLETLVRENQQSVNNILVNFDKTSKALSDSSGDMQLAIKGIADATQQLAQFSRNTDQLVQNDLKSFVRNADDTAKSLSKVANNLDRIMAENGPVDRFANNGLGQMPELVAEMRSLVKTLDRVVSRAEDDPARFLVGNRVPEVEAK
jgi:phospholipid/cholesterol/gamma-HCH transport system substrate-binding protein